MDFYPIHCQFSILLFYIKNNLYIYCIYRIYVLVLNNYTYTLKKVSDK